MPSLLKCIGLIDCLADVEADHVRHKHLQVLPNHQHMQYLQFKIPYFLDFFPWVLLISVPARTWVQFEGGNKTRVRSISLSSACRALQCTRSFSVPRCEYFCTWSSTHLVWISLLCGHYSRAGLILLSSTHTCSAGSIQGREEIEEIQYCSLVAEPVG